jgi:hypothetical protein
VVRFVIDNNVSINKPSNAELEEDYDPNVGENPASLVAGREGKTEVDHTMENQKGMESCFHIQPDGHIVVTIFSFTIMSS